MGRGERHLMTSESVTEGHPDKMADQISDAILDAIMHSDPDCRVACETLVTTGLAFVAGEISTNTYIDITKVVRTTIKEVGYTKPEYGFCYQNCAVVIAVQEQSNDISLGVNVGGAGDQGMMYGYATNETEQYMPLPIILAHQLVAQLAAVRKEGKLKYLRPDGKSQVTVEYKGGKPVKVPCIVISTQHNPGTKVEQIKRDVIQYVIKPVLPEKYRDKNMEIYVNPTGRFVIGGPQADTGLTGRKIMVDTYGGIGRHGGGCFSGKDPTKVDRSAAYMARYIAKNIVAAGVADKCEIQLAYAIGVSEPVSIMVETYGTEVVKNKDIVRAVREIFDLRPRSIIDALKLQRPIYKNTACYGHFGRSGNGFSWEHLDKTEELKRVLKLT